MTTLVNSDELVDKQYAYIILYITELSSDEASKLSEIVDKSGVGSYSCSNGNEHIIVDMADLQMEEPEPESDLESEKSYNDMIKVLVEAKNAKFSEDELRLASFIMF